MGPVICTDNFSYFGPNEAANFALANQINTTTKVMPWILIYGL
jgi:hypothetical protein